MTLLYTLNYFRDGFAKFVSCKQDKARQDGAITIDLFGHCKCNGLAVTKYNARNNGFYIIKFNNEYISGIVITLSVCDIIAIDAPVFVSAPNDAGQTTVFKPNGVA